MKDAHIIGLLESSPLAALSEGEMAIIRAHAANCAECRRAFEAAQISALLLKERAAEVIEPSPFFQTRVLAALREQQAAGTSAPSLWRLWKATGALVSGMAATVAALTVFTFVAPSSNQAPQEAAATFDSYSAEEVILSAGDLRDHDLSYDQVLAAVYESDEDAE